MMQTNSLSFRLIALSALWAVIALVTTAVILTTIIRKNAENGFNDLLNAHLYNLIGGVEISTDGKLSGSPSLGDPRFSQPGSGWYWSIQSLSNTKNSSRLSRSLADDPLVLPAAKDIPFSSGFTRAYNFIRGGSEDLRVVEAQVLVGEGDDLYLFVVAGSRDSLKRDLGQVINSLYLFLGIFGLGTVLSTIVVIRFGLRPLGRASKGLSDIREGRADRLDGEFPTEIKPLIEELNALIVTNKGVVDRARTQVGNLAHALKTPLSVLLNAADNDQSALPDMVREQVYSMQQHVQHYLDRAQIAAQKGSISSRTEIAPTMERLLRVMRRLNPQLVFEFSCDKSIPGGKLPDFKGEQQDFEEMLGNLIENASKFAVSKVQTKCSIAGQKKGWVQISVEDDGKGLSDDEMQTALQRGKRLDERKAGSGLGLSIVKDICEEYGGKIVLKSGQLSGLRVEISIPAIPSRKKQTL